MGDGKENFHLDMTDDVVRGSIVLNNGVTSWPPNPPISVAAAAPKGGAAAAAAAAAPVEVNHFNEKMKTALSYTAGLGTINALQGRLSCSSLKNPSPSISSHLYN